MKVPAVIVQNRKTVLAIGAVSLTCAILYILYKYLKQSVIKSNSMEMQISEKGKDFIVKLEGGYVLTGYADVGGVPTIGAGHTGAGVSVGKQISLAEAKRLFDADVLRFERIIQGLNVSLTQNQFDALVSFCYNTGATKSTLYNLVKEDASNPAIANEFRKWKFVNGKVITGQVNRREKEIDLYFS
jgi:lysozyme